MQVYRDLSEFPVLPNLVLTQGTFDGVHIGHQKILARIRELALESGGEVGLMTFHPHPRKVLFPDQTDLQLLTTLREKMALMKANGVQHLLVQPFSFVFARMTYEEFVRDILAGKLHVKTLVIGYDHQFGRDRKGSFKELKEMAPACGFRVEEIPEQDIDDVAVSSTRIRKFLFAGEVRQAAGLLGYEYTLTGTVVKGKQLGRTLGFPTANILPEESDKLIPGNGVYAVMVQYKGIFYKGVMNIGNRPTFDNGPRSIEVNIFDFNHEIYGEEITLHFVEFLRPELKFNSKEELIDQMNLDKQQSVELLKDR